MVSPEDAVEEKEEKKPPVFKNPEFQVSSDESQRLAHIHASLLSNLSRHMYQLYYYLTNAV